MGGGRVAPNFCLWFFTRRSSSRPVSLCGAAAQALRFQSNFIDTASVTVEEVPTGTRSRTRVLRGHLFSTRLAAPGTLRFASCCTFVSYQLCGPSCFVVVEFFFLHKHKQAGNPGISFFGVCELSASFLSCCRRLSAFLSFFSSSLLFLSLVLPKRVPFRKRHHKGR